MINEDDIDQSEESKSVFGKSKNNGNRNDSKDGDQTLSDASDIEIDESNQKKKVDDRFIHLRDEAQSRIGYTYISDEEEEKKVNEKPQNGKKKVKGPKMKTTKEVGDLKDGLKQTKLIFGNNKNGKI